MKKMKMETMPKSRGGSMKMKSDMNEEAPGVINKKHFGHVVKTANALHSSDPYKHQK